MSSPVCKMLGLDVPIFAFSHCRDVVAAVSKAGGMGVYGAALHSDEQIAIDLKWIEEQVGGRPYGVDLLMPSKYVGQDVGGLDPEAAHSLVPEAHKAFLEDMMARHGVPHSEADDDAHGVFGGTRYTAHQAEGILEAVFSHRPTLLVSALGTPPAEVVERAHAVGMHVGALAGQVKHALRHKDAGVDIIIAQSYEAAGHTGTIGGMVLVPEIVDAVAPTPVLMAGGIGRGRQFAAALALGAQGVWCGSVWLTTVESELSDFMRQKLIDATVEDTARTRSYTGKHARFLKTPWSEEWDRPDTPDPLPTPLQSAAISKYLLRIRRVVNSGTAVPDQGAGLLASHPVGQIVGSLNRVTSCRQVIMDMMEEFIEATESIKGFLDEGDAGA